MWSFLSPPLVVRLAAVLAGLLVGSPAIADSLSVRGPVLVSGPTPFPAGCPPDSPEPGTENAAYEPTLVVDRRTPARLAAAWIQDGGLAILAGFSVDGGRRWMRLRVPGASHCTGGRTGGAVDPWLTQDRSGTMYLSSLGADLAPGFPLSNPQTQVTVDRSADLGSRWLPVTAAQPEDGGYYDKPSITADPQAPGKLYAVWARRQGVTGASGVSLFAQSSDSAKSWSTPRTIYDPGPVPPQWPHGNVITVLPHGALVDVFALANDSPYISSENLPDAEMASRSTNGGRSWSTAVKIADLPSRLPADGSSEADRLDAIPIPSVTLDRHGTLYVAWHQNPSQTSGAIMIARSADGGRSWSEPAAAAAYGGQAFFPALANRPDGTLGLLWYDTRHDTPGDGKLTTEVWFATSHDQGRSWHETHVAGPFDALSGPDFFGVGRTIGDYESLASTPTGFDALITQAKPISPLGATSVYFAAIELTSKLRVTVRRLSLKVAPPQAIAGKRTRFRFTVTTAQLTRAGRPAVPRTIAGVLIRLAGHATHTDRRGRASLVLTLHGHRRYVVTATKRGFLPDRTTVIVDADSASCAGTCIPQARERSDGWAEE
jgi:hypothetical protein